MKKHLLVLLSILISIPFYGQSNTDTPNLSFEKGNFSNWERYTGCFYYLSSTSTYQYDPWVPLTTNSSRFVIGSNNNDPLVACDLKNSPTDKNAARIGEPLKREYGSSSYKGAAAEQMIYRFKVTANTTLLSYKLAAVLRTPTGDGHGGEQQPVFMMNIKVKDTAGNETYLTCSDYSTIADFANPKLLRNKTKTECPSSTAPTPEDYTYQPWYAGNLDLSQHLGDSVIVIITNRDCLYNYGGSAGIKGGTHEAYGYFWAETRKLELTSFSCENEDATINAPQGFTLYEWSRSDNFPVTVPDPVNYPNVAKIEKTLNFQDVVYYCKMTDANAGCGNTITIHTKIIPVVITPGFSFDAIDAGKIKFTNSSTISGDTISKYFWEFGDGDTDNTSNPTHTYNEFKQFTVKLTVTSSKGCSKTYSHNVLPTKELIATIYPPANLQYNGQTKDFGATTNISGLQMNIDYFIKYTNKAGTAYYNSYTAPATAGDYNATFELSFQSLLKYFMTSVPSQDFSITKAPLTVTVNSISKTYGEKITLQREGFVSSMNPLYAGDKIYELNVNCKGLADTASVNMYSIKADSAIGLGVQNYAVQFVDGLLTVNPKAIAIKASDNSKTYGDMIVPTGREFYIAPGALVGTDSVKTVTLTCKGYSMNAPVGTDTIHITDAAGYRLSNYTLTYKNALLEIGKKKLTINAKALAKVYGTPHTFSRADYVVDNVLFVGTDSISNLAIASGAAAFNAPVNEYPIVLSSPTGPGMSNYDIKLVNNTFTVNTKPVTIKANDLSKDYGDTYTFKGNEYSLNTPMIAGDTINSITLSSNATLPTAAIGSYAIIPSKAYGQGTLNYTFNYVNGEMNVVKKKLTASITPPANLNYNATAKIFTAKVSVSTLIMNVDYFIRYTNRAGTATYNSTNAPTAAGDYTATFEPSAATLLNYQIDVIPSEDFSIAKVPVKVSIDNASKTYGDSYTLSSGAFKSSLYPLYGTDKISFIDLQSAATADTASVGNYPISSVQLNGTGLENYLISVEDGIFTVLKKSLTIKTGNQTKTYGDQLNPNGTEFSVDAKQLVGKDAVARVTLSSAGFATAAAVGVYDIVASNATGTGLNNYTLNYSPGNLVVSKKTLIISALAQRKAYGSTYTFTGREFSKSTNFIGSDTIYSAQLSSTASAMKTAVGSYPILLTGITGAGISNYDITLYGNTFTIDPINIVITANDIQKQFGTVLTFTGHEFSTNIPLVSGDTINMVLLKSIGTQAMAPVGDYEIEASQAYGPGSLNYDFSYRPGTLSVSKQKLNATLHAPAYLQYNALPKDYSATTSISGLIQNNDYVIRYVQTGNTSAYDSYVAPTAAGSYRAIFELTAVSQMRYYMDSTVYQNFTIAKAPIILTPDNVTKTYGEKVLLSGSAFKSNMQPLYGSDKISYIDPASAGVTDTASVGKYPITASKAYGIGTENYAISFADGVLEVRTKSITVKAPDLQKTYGDLYNPSGSEFSTDHDTFVGDDGIQSVTVSCAGFGSAAPVGSYALTNANAIGKGLSNYRISYQVGSLQVTKKEVWVSARKQTKTYGSEFNFSGNEYIIRPAIRIGTDSAGLATLVSAASAARTAAGEYRIQISNLTGRGLDNYQLNYTDSSFTVVPKKLTVRADSLEKSYGELLNFTGKEFSATGLAPGDTLSYALLRSEGTPSTAGVGKYPIAVGQLFGIAAGNYEITYFDGLLSVNKQKLVATLKAPSYLGYNAQSKDFSATTNVTGLQQNRDYELRYQSVPDTTVWNSNTAPSAAGQYVVKFILTGLSPERYYTDTLPYRYFSITKAPLTLTADNATKTYGETLNLLKTAFKTDMKPLFGTDAIYQVEFNCNGLADTVSVGSYPIVPKAASGDGVENYDIHYLAGTLTIKAKAIEIRALSSTKNYGYAVLPKGNEFYLNANDLVAGDTVNVVTVTSDGYAATAPTGTYPIVLSQAQGRGLSNYIISYNSATLQVLKRKITLNALPQTKVYGEVFSFKGNEFSTDTGALVGRDSITYVEFSSTACGVRAAAGDHPIYIGKVTGKGLDNYDIATVNNIFTVSPLTLTITANDATKAYGNLLTFKGDEFGTDRALVSGDTISFVLLQSDGCATSAEVGHYDIRISQANGGTHANYNFLYKSGNLTVEKAILTPNLHAPDYMGYDSKAKTVTATMNISGLIQNTDYFIRYRNAGNTPAYDSYLAPSNVGNYVATFELSQIAKARYTLSAEASEAFCISKAALTLTADNATKVYGSSLSLRGDAYTADMKPLYGSDKIFSVQFSCAGLSDTASVGTYPIEIISSTGNGLENYDISFGTGTLQVTPKALTIQAIDLSKTYGETISTESVSFFISAGMLAGKDAVSSVTINSEGLDASAAVGTYPVKLSNATGRGLQNYRITYTDGRILVGKKTLTVKANAMQKEYGTNYIFKGDEFEIAEGTLTGNDKINSVKLNSIGASGQASVGEYVVSVTDISGYRTENYDIKLQSNLFTVTPIALTITANNQTKGYGDLLSFSGSEFSLDRQMVNNDTISFVFLKSNGTAAGAAIGDYEIVPSQAFGKGSLNYLISYRSGTLSVTKKMLYLAAGSYKKEYGENDPVFSFTVTDARGVEYVPSLFSGKISREAGETPGTYRIEQGSLSIGNSYSFQFTAGELQIKKATPTLDPSFSNDGGTFILSDVIGTKNGDNPSGKVQVTIESVGFGGESLLANGSAKCAVSGLPEYKTAAVVSYAGDANYLPVSRTIYIYAIRYHCNGGSLVAPVTHFDGTESVKLESPTRDQNYRFEGWYESVDFTGDALRRIPTGTYDDVDVYAKWSASYDDLSIVVLFNQVLAVANPQNREFLSKATYKWYKDGVLLGSTKQYCGFDNYVPTGQYKVEIYYQNDPVIILELNHTAVSASSKVYPNPLQKTAALHVSTTYAESDEVTVEVFNAIGMKVGSIQCERQPAGYILRGFSCAGVYFIRLFEKGKLLETHKVIVEN